MSTVRLFFAAPFALALAFGQQPQQPVQEQEPPPIKVDVDVVNLLCSVRNKGGGLVGNLDKGDFTLNEDGKSQTIKYFTRESDLPLTIGLLVDVSRSQERLIDIEREAAEQFFSQVLRKKDLAFLISFGEDAELLQDYTGSARLLRDGLNGLHVSAPVGGLHPGPVPTIYNPKGTILYDAVYLAANEKLKGQVGRKVSVLITDGVDQGSHYHIEDALRSAQKADAIIYSIYYYDPSEYRDQYGISFGGGGEGYLKRMSEETGGHVFRVDRKHTLQDAFAQIQQEMRSQYAIGYVPTNQNRDGGFRRIDLRTKEKDMKVQVRKGYYATKPDES